MRHTGRAIAIGWLLLVLCPAAPLHAERATRAEIQRADTLRRELTRTRREEAGLRHVLDGWSRAVTMADSEEQRATLTVEGERLRARLDTLVGRLQALARELEALPPDARTPQVLGAATPADPQGLTPLDVTGGSSQVGDPRAFNPAVSVIPDTVFFRDSRRGASPALLAGADGFESAPGAAAGPSLEEGFSLRETELAFNASVDPYFDAFALVVVSPNAIAVEEVYAQTRRLPAGLQLRGGRFLSWFGYMNRQHPHQWDFVDQNVALQLLLGPGGIGETGMQATWLPSLPFFLQIGGELLQGRTPAFANHLGGQSYAGAAPGSPDRVPDYHAGPRLLTAFGKFSPNLGYSHTLQIGASFAGSLAHQEVYDRDADGVPEDVLDGAAALWGIDVVHRYDSPKGYGAGDVSVQAEYVRRTRRFDVLGTALRDRRVNDGLYAQASYGIAPRWQLAGRTSIAGLVNTRARGDSREVLDAAIVHSATITFNATEFSRLRLQYNRGRAPVSGQTERYHQLFVQLQVSLGAHGAHTY